MRVFGPQSLHRLGFAGFRVSSIRTPFDWKSCLPLSIEMGLMRVGDVCGCGFIRIGVCRAHGLKWFGASGKASCLHPRRLDVGQKGSSILEGNATAATNGIAEHTEGSNGPWI